MKKYRESKAKVRQKKSDQIRCAKETLMRKEHDEKLIKSSMHDLRKQMRQKKQDFENLFVKRWLCVIANKQRIIRFRSKLEALREVEAKSIEVMRIMKSVRNRAETMTSKSNEK